jgi:hypothetical protein
MIDGPFQEKSKQIFVKPQILDAHVRRIFAMGGFYGPSKSTDKMIVCTSLAVQWSVQSNVEYLY